MGFMGRNLPVSERIVVIAVGMAILCPLEAFSGARMAQSNWSLTFIWFFHFAKNTPLCSSLVYY